MTSSTDIVSSTVADVINVNSQGVAQFTEQAAKLVTRMLCKDADAMEMAFFASYCKRLNLDPFSGHVHLVKRGTGGDKVARPELSISGALLIAERSGKYRGRTDYQWCGDDGVWVDVWLAPVPPRAARVGVYRDGAEHPIYGVALWDSYVGKTHAGHVNRMWQTHGPRMLGKCALRLALGDALPAELGGVYISEEMHQADNGSSTGEPLTPGQVACLQQLNEQAGTAPAVAKVRIGKITDATYQREVEALEQRIREQETVAAAQAERESAIEPCPSCAGLGDIDGDVCGDCAGLGEAA